MTKKELELVQAFADLESACNKIEFYDDQQEQIDEMDRTLKEFKTLFHNLITEEEVE